MDVRWLRQQIAGVVVEADDAAYEAVRRSMVWNRLTPERRPAVIVGAASEADVVAAIRFARDQQLQVAVRGGGHHWSGAALREGGMLLDLARLNQVTVDAAHGTAAVQPAVCNRDLTRQLAAHGYAFPVGHCSTVPLSGYILGGGFGWNAGAWGPACFSLQAVEVVTAAGELVTADETQHADLFWAARGAGPGFFGVATRYHLTLYPLPRAITTSTYAYPLECAEGIARWVAEVGPTLSRQVELALVLATAPPSVIGRCAASNGKICIVMATAFVETDAEARTALAPLEQWPAADQSLTEDLYRPTPFDALFEAMDGFFPEGCRYAADTLWSRSPPAQVMAVLRQQIVAAPSPRSLILSVVPPPPPAGAPPPPDAAFSMSAGMLVLAYAVWDDPAEDAANLTWHRATMAAAQPFAVGRYIGESDIVATPSHAEQAFAPPNWQRLQALRRQYDPDGVFHSFFG